MWLVVLYYSIMGHNIHVITADRPKVYETHHACDRDLPRIKRHIAARVEKEGVPAPSKIACVKLD
jgi:hypothetical protein